jgi:hypothetical protein
VDDRGVEIVLEEFVGVYNKKKRKTKKTKKVEKEKEC